ncbi:MAG: hypothetical protein HKN27_09190 [Silicimonas sp.]|nr:hypothetical protein [Silicimonas sp.]
MHFRKRRKPTNFFVTLEVNRVSFELRLTDITPEGARLQGPHEVVDGTKGVLTVRGKTFEGTLKWVDEDKIGFEFDKPLPADIYALLAHEKRPSAKRQRVFS